MKVRQRIEPRSTNGHSTVYWLAVSARHFLYVIFEPRYGDYSGVVPPDPIPNSEVKYTKADDSRKAKVGSPRIWV